MKVIYDYQIFQMQKFGGISRYFYELLKYGNKLNDGMFDLDLMFSHNEYLKEASFSHGFIFGNEKVYNKTYRILNKLNQMHSIRNLKTTKYDLFHPTFYESYFLNRTQIPYVLTVYDLINEKFPEYFNKNEEFIQRKKILMENAAKIIAISNNTKDDIVEYFHIPEDKIEVTYLAESLTEVNSKSISNLPNKYILYTGKRSGYKNFDLTYKTLVPFLKEYQDLALVCAGGGNFSHNEFNQYRNDGLEGRVKYISFDSNEELKFLYESCLFFILPSLYEGFGIPVLESYSSKALTILSETSSLKEIGEDGAIYFDPSSEGSLKQAINKALDIKLHQNASDIYTDKAFKISQKYSWKNTYNDTIRVYKGCLK